jgi:hypothetical protein
LLFLEAVVVWVQLHDEYESKFLDRTESEIVAVVVEREVGFVLSCQVEH